MWGSRTRLPATEDELARGASRLPPWQQMILAALRARYMPPRAAPVRERSPVGRGVGGCLTRLVLVVVLLFVALASATFLFGQSLLRF